MFSLSPESSVLCFGRDRGRGRVDRGFVRPAFAGLTAKPEKGCPIQLFLKVAAPWGRGDLSATASGYSISGFAVAAIIFANISKIAE